VRNKPNLVIFDLDGTLYNYEENHQRGLGALEQFLSDELGIDISLVRSGLSTARTNVKNRLGPVASSHKRLLYIREFLLANNNSSNFEISLRGEEIYWSAYLKEAVLFPDAQEFIELLKISEVSLALVTDLNSEIQFRKISWFHLENAFDFVITSEEAGGDKITGRPEKFLSSLFKHLPENIWCVGDQNYDHLFKANSSFFLKTKADDENSRTNVSQPFSSYQDLIKLFRSTYSLK
jgi:putative hydrolase of the HAD superfamily